MLADVHVATRQPKKSRILSPDRTAESQGGCANRPVVRFACVEPLPRFGFEIAIEVQAAASRARLWISETPMLSWDRRRVVTRTSDTGH